MNLSGIKSRLLFSIEFFTISLLYLIFDIEIILIVPIFPLFESAILFYVTITAFIFIIIHFIIRTMTCTLQFLSESIKFILLEIYTVNNWLRIMYYNVTSTITYYNITSAIIFNTFYLKKKGNL